MSSTTSGSPSVAAGPVHDPDRVALSVEVAILPRPVWLARARAHESRVRPWTEPRLGRRSRGEKHPVDDFLFDYYRLRPAGLRTWHPGIDHALADAQAPYIGHRDYVVSEGLARVSDGALRRRRAQLGRAVEILSAQRGRTATFSCFGMHEWAMVHGLRQQEIRHEQLPLRVSPDQVIEVVAEVGLACSHFDAYRFFTPSATALQRPLSRDNQSRDEQPGCLHAGMDLYRYAYEAGPLLASELVADCFEHARRAREVDMRASPYDVSALGLSPIEVETAAGRAQYAREQRALAQAAEQLRNRLLPVLANLLRRVT